MKILLVSLNWVEYLIEMANALTVLGHRVEIIVKKDRVRETVGDALPRLLHPSVRAHEIDDRPRGLRDPRQLHTIARLVRLVRTIAPDVINLHEATTTYLPFCMRLWGRQPIVLTVHDVTTHPGQDSVEPDRRARVRAFQRRHASAIILHGTKLREQYLADPGDGCRNVHVIPHGCYALYRHWALEGVEEIPHSVLFFGRIHAYKGLDVLLGAADRIAARVPGFRILVAGDGSELERLRGRLEGARCIVRSGYLGNAEVAEVFQQASLVVLPYIEGSQSGVVRIAYVFGKPVVVTDVGSVPESVRDGVTGLIVPPRDEAALADAIVALLSDDGRRRTMGAAATRLADTELSWATVARRTEPIFRELVPEAT